MAKAIQVPAGFDARDYQKPLFNALHNGVKRGVAVWHRRAGKDKVFMAMCASAAFQRKGIYFYILPFYAQARKIIWEGMDASGTPNLSVFPAEVIAHKNNQDMVLKLINGSVIYFLGSDNVDSIVGTNPVGVFFSEYSVHKPHVWDFLRPILVENGGFAFFNGTPRGKNHLHKLLKAAQEDPDNWFSQVLTIQDTDVMTDEQVEKEIREGMDRATAKQEFYCSFDAALTGAYYDEAMQSAQDDDRIKPFSYDPAIRVDVAWDLGISDTMVLVLSQTNKNETKFIDVIAENGKGLDYYVKELQRKPYIYGNHYLPHDIRVREIGNGGKTRLQTLYDLGLTNLLIAPKLPIDDGINEVRKLLYRSYFRTPATDTLVEALKSYRKEWHSERQVFGKAPLHDWSSHYADAMRTHAVAARKHIDTRSLTPVALGTGYDPLRPDAPSYAYGGGTEVQQKPFGGRYNEHRSWDPANHTIADGFYSGHYGG